MIVIEEYHPVVVRLAFSELDADRAKLFEIEEDVLPLVIGETWKRVGKSSQERTQPDFRMRAVLAEHELDALALVFTEQRRNGFECRLRTWLCRRLHRRRRSHLDLTLFLCLLSCFLAKPLRFTRIGGILLQALERFHVEERQGIDEMLLADVLKEIAREIATECHGLDRPRLRLNVLDHRNVIPVSGNEDEGADVRPCVQNLHRVDAQAHVRRILVLGAQDIPDLDPHQVQTPERHRCQALEIRIRVAHYRIQAQSLLKIGSEVPEEFQRVFGQLRQRRVLVLQEVEDIFEVDKNRGITSLVSALRHLDLMLHSRLLG
jgi:hypothetical protein